MREDAFLEREETSQKVEFLLRPAFYLAEILRPAIVPHRTISRISGKG
jgi:hypothetical protein